MKGILDADLPVYRGGYSSEKRCYKVRHVPSGTVTDYGEGVTRSQIIKDLKEKGLKGDDVRIGMYRTVEPVAHCLYTVKRMIQNILDECKLDSLELFLTSSDKSNYRFKIASEKPYKGNRTQPKPIHYQAIRDYLVDIWGAIIVSGREADDEISLRSNEDTVIISIDKDLDMVPGWHYNFVTKEKYYIDELTGWKNFYTQLLRGDNADNIPGIDGCGPVTAGKILDKCNTKEEMFNNVYKKYKKTYGGEALGKIIERGNLLWMQRKDMLLWEPPSECLTQLGILYESQELMAALRAKVGFQ